MRLLVAVLASRQFYTIQVDGQLFHIDIRYQHLKVIGRGSYGVVCSADDVVGVFSFHITCTDCKQTSSDKENWKSVSRYC